MIEGKYSEHDVKTPRLLEAIKTWQDNLGDMAAAMSDCAPAPHWLQALRFLLKEDIEKAGVSEAAAQELFAPVVGLMRTLVLLYTVAETEEEIQTYLKDV